jgi:hypothetical protein
MVNTETSEVTLANSIFPVDYVFAPEATQARFCVYGGPA